MLFYVFFLVFYLDTKRELVKNRNRHVDLAKEKRKKNNKRNKIIPNDKNGHKSMRFHSGTYIFDGSDPSSFFHSDIN